MKTATDLLMLMRRQGQTAAKASSDVPDVPLRATMTGPKSCRAKDFNEDFTEDDLIFHQRDLEDSVVKVEEGSSGLSDEDHYFTTISHPTHVGTHVFSISYNRKLKKGDEVILIPVGDKFLVEGRVEG